ncbi:MAG: GNAT family N-acetyltransferase [Loktanella sp.]|nr:GNAT family N-acetyltransferase [Loktanella sp.]
MAQPVLLAVSDEHLRAGQNVVAEDAYGIVGLAAVTPRPDGLELKGLFSHPNQWEQGIGRFLIESAAEQFGNCPTGNMYVMAGPDAKSFYQACEFEVVGETDTQFGPAIAMMGSGRK